MAGNLGELRADEECGPSQGGRLREIIRS